MTPAPSGRRRHRIALLSLALVSGLRGEEAATGAPPLMDAADAPLPGLAADAVAPAPAGADAACASRPRRAARRRTAPGFDEAQVRRWIHEARATHPYPESEERMLAVLLCESGGNARAVNPAGPYLGLFQYHPRTWARPANPYREEDVFDARAQVFATACMWSQGRQREWGCYRPSAAVDDAVPAAPPAAVTEATAAVTEATAPVSEAPAPVTEAPAAAEALQPGIDSSRPTARAMPQRRRARLRRAA